MSLGPRHRKRLLILAWVYALMAASIVTWKCGCEYRDPRTQSLTGRTEAQIRGYYGSPVSQDDGYTLLGHQGMRRGAPSGSYRTLVFNLRNSSRHEGGTLYVWFEQKENQWVCFESRWIPENVVIG
jgi:hypothetical protein